MEVSIGEVNTSLAAILARLERMQDGERNRAHQHHRNDGSVGSVSTENDYVYAGDTKHDDEVDAQPHRQLHRNSRGMGARLPRREVRENDDSLGKIKFTMPSFDGKYDPDAYLTWELAADQKFACHDFPENKWVRAATSDFTDFASIWWSEYCHTNPNNTPQT